jgi:D-alanine-D-alanine ligase
MSANRKTTVAVIFGGRSVEHEVSIVTGHQVIRGFDPERYEIVPIYVDREGRWFTGDPLLELKNFQNEVVSLSGVQPAIISPAVQHHGLILNPTPSGLFGKSQIKRLDVVFPAIHGSHGEDGTLQGLFELADIPYVGCGVLASAVANDKVIAKQVLKQNGIPVVKGINFSRHEWEQEPEALVERIEAELAFPVFVKPVTLGSSIGVARVESEELLRPTIDVASNFDRRLMVESAVTNCIEINCAVIGDERNIQPSILEQPLSYQPLLTFEEKYLRGGEGMKSAERIVPAPISTELTERIQNLAIRTFRAVDGRGTARIDFLVRPEHNEVFVNELNTMPGSVAFYLWQEMGMSARDVVERLVEIAREAHAQKRRNTYNYQTSLIALTAARGVKGLKGAKSRQSQSRD